MYSVNDEISEEKKNGHSFPTFAFLSGEVKKPQETKNAQLTKKKKKKKEKYSKIWVIQIYCQPQHYKPSSNIL